MDFANISRANLIKIGVAAIIVLLLLSRCGGSDTEPDQDVNLDSLDGFHLEDIPRDIDMELPMPDIPVFEIPATLDDLNFNREDFVDVWKPTTTPYGPTCDSSDCQILSTREGSVHGAAGTQIVFNPKIDDAIAQWGDCIMEVSVCFYEDPSEDISSREMQDIFAGCVQKSACPIACKDAYSVSYEASRSKPAWDVFEDVFSGEDALCRPEEVWRE